MRLHLILRNLPILALLFGLSGFAPVLQAQDVPSVKADELKKAPQKFWAGFFVFEDVLEELPGDTTICIDDVDYVRFKTRTIGTLYAESAVVERVRLLEVGQSYLFVGTVAQKSGSFFGLLGGGKFVVIVSDVSEAKQDAVNITGRLPDLELQLTTNRVNQTFARLDEIFKEVQTDMLGFASSQGIELPEAFSAAHRDKVAASVRSALRRYEDKNRGNSQELFVDVIISMMAVQYGHGEAKKEVYEPAEIAPVEPAALEETRESGVESYPEVKSAEEWDISEVIKEIEETPAEPSTGEAPAPVVAEPDAEAQPEPAIESPAEPVAAPADQPSTVAPAEANNPD